MNSPTEIVEKQNTIIRLQSEIIDDLFGLLMQHISSDEAGELPIIQKINEAARLQQEIEQT